MKKKRRPREDGREKCAKWMTGINQSVWHGGQRSFWCPIALSKAASRHWPVHFSFDFAENRKIVLTPKGNGTVYCWIFRE
jgi:hypothetical protein